MAEKRRGLGRGLGALIPNVVTEDRPVDVFFPASGEEVSRETRRETSKDPAEGMRKARASKRAQTTPERRTKAGRKAAAGANPSAVKEAGTAAEAPAADEPTTPAPTRESATADSSVRGGAAAKAAARVAADGAADADAASADHSKEQDLVAVPGTAFGMLKLTDIHPNPRQPRTVFDEDALEELVTSIQQVGILQPVVVRVVDPTAPRYELIMGERRFRASKEAGLTEIPAIIREVPETDLLRDALLENLHRADLNPLEEAAAYQQLLEDFACTQEELSQRIGRSRPQISNTLRLLKLPALVQRRVAAGVLSQGHARAILGLKDPAAMEALAQRVVAEGLSVRATEEAVVLANRGEEKKPKRRLRPLSPELSSIAERMGDRLDTRVSISMGRRKGKISVEFAGQEDLERILQVLGLPPQD